MKYLKLFESFDDIHDICKKYGITNYTINEDGSIDVNNSSSLPVNFESKGLSELPLNFRNVDGSFTCSFNNLTSLKGCPERVGNNFICTYNNIKSFEGFPKHIGGYFYVYGNPIEEILDLFEDKSKIEFFNDCDIIQDGVVILDRLNYFLEEIGQPTVNSVKGYEII